MKDMKRHFSNILTRNLSFWLVPSEQDRSFFEHLIDTLAQEHDAPSFVPHVTLYSGETTADDDPLDSIEKSTQGVKGLSLHVDSVLYTEQFTKTLFVQFHPSPLLRSISERMKHLSSKPSGYILNPHMSLMYKDMSEQGKHQLAATIRLPSAEVSFDEVWAIASLGPTHTPEDVHRWNVVCRQHL